MAAFTPIRPNAVSQTQVADHAKAAEADQAETRAAISSILYPPRQPASTGAQAIATVQGAAPYQAATARTGAQAITPSEAKAPATAPVSMDAVYAAIVDGNLVGLKPQERLAYYNRLCEGLGLNPLTKPFGFYEMKGQNNKTVVHVYALKECAAQLAKRDCVSVEIVKTEWIKDSSIYEVWARATSQQWNPITGQAVNRVTDEIGVVALDATAKADGAGVQRMKAVTKARRRCILAHCGLGLLDETEIDSVEGARIVNTNAFLSGEEDKRTPPPAQTPGAASVRIENVPGDASIRLPESVKLTPAAHVQEAQVVHEPSDANDAKEQEDANFFDATVPSHMDWLMRSLKTAFPSSMRAVLVQLAETLKSYQSREVITAEIAKHKAKVSV